MGTAANEDPPDGIIERALLKQITALCRKTPRPDVTTGLVGWKYARENGLALRKFNGGDRPLPIMALDRDPQAVKFVKPDILNRTSLTVREDHRLSDKLRASVLERAEYARG
jgi:hypothetical protein